MFPKSYIYMSDSFPIKELIAETHAELYKQHQILGLWIEGIYNRKNWKALFDIWKQFLVCNNLKYPLMLGEV